MMKWILEIQGAMFLTYYSLATGGSLKLAYQSGMHDILLLHNPIALRRLAGFCFPSMARQLN